MQQKVDRRLPHSVELYFFNDGVTLEVKAPLGTVLEQQGWDNLARIRSEWTTLDNIIM